MSIKLRILEIEKEDGVKEQVLQYRTEWAGKWEGIPIVKCKESEVKVNNKLWGTYAPGVH